MKTLFILILLSTSSVLLADDQCKSNFTKSGGFLKGSTYKTYTTLGSLNHLAAYNKIYLHLAKDGWNITNSNKEIGIINASQEVSYGKGKSSPLNIIVESINQTDTKISISFSTSGGLITSKKAAIKSFCGMIESAR